MQNSPDVDRFVRNRWIWLACLDSESGTLWELRSSGFVPHAAESLLATIIGESATWYGGKRGFLPPVAIVSSPSATGDTGPRHSVEPT